MRQQLRAVNDGNAEVACPGDIGDMLLDRGRDHERGAVVVDSASVLRVDDDAEPFELGARGASLAAVEGALAAARPAARHHLELGERAHAAASEAGVVESAWAAGIGKRAHRHPGRAMITASPSSTCSNSSADIGIRHADAAVRGRRARSSSWLVPWI